LGLARHPGPKVAERATERRDARSRIGNAVVLLRADAAADVALAAVGAGRELAQASERVEAVVIPVGLPSPATSMAAAARVVEAVRLAARAWAEELELPPALALMARAPRTALGGQAPMEAAQTPS
jgi:hypothetical protein